MYPLNSMKRRIIKQGNNSYTITLPIKWIRQNNITGNEEISVEEEENQLRIATEKKQERKNITIELNENNPRSIRFVIQQAYRQNYDQITINYDSEAIYKTLVEIIDNYFVGLEVVEKHKNSCTISVIVETNEEKFKIFLRKMFLLIKDSLNSLASKDSASVHYNYLKLYAYQNYGKRYIYSKKAELSSYDYYSLLSYLLNIHSDIDKFASQLKDYKNIKLDENANIIIGIFENIERNFYLKKIDILMRITENIQKTIVDLQNVNTLQKEGFLVLHYQIEILRLLYGALSPILGIVLYESRKTS